MNYSGGGAPAAQRSPQGAGPGFAAGGSSAGFNQTGFSGGNSTGAGPGFQHTNSNPTQGALSNANTLGSGVSGSGS